jgi:hypothetical protein
LFGVENELEKHQLCIHTLRSAVTAINFADGSMTMACPKLPKDTDARIGVRRDPQNPNKKQKIFGYNLVLTTSIELHLKIESASGGSPTSPAMPKRAARSSPMTTK